MHSLRSGLQLEEWPGRTGASINHHTEGNQMPRDKHDSDKHDSKVVDNGNEDGGRKSRGPAVNRVILVGRLTGDPELSYMPSGTAVTQLRLATNEGEQPEFHQVRAWGKVAEFAGSYLKKGRLVYVEGRLHWSSWQASDGSPRRSCEVRVSSLQVLDQRLEPSEQTEGEGQ
jgi:single-strand DNA-binding protein